MANFISEDQIEQALVSAAQSPHIGMMAFILKALIAGR